MYNSFKSYRTAPIGPFHGISLSESAAEAALMANTSGRLAESTANILHTSWVSLLKSAGKSGRIERSISLPDKISFSVGPVHATQPDKHRYQKAIFAIPTQFPAHKIRRYPSGCCRFLTIVHHKRHKRLRGAWFLFGHRRYHD